jgi:septum site-determining protein MinC
MVLPLAIPNEGSAEQPEPPVTLRGTSAGLEIVVDGSASAEEIGEALATRLAQSPGFFAGNDVSVRVDGRLPPGALSRLEEVTARFQLRIAEVGPPRRAATHLGPEPVPVPDAESTAAARAPDEVDIDLDIGLDAQDPPEPGSPTGVSPDAGVTGPEGPEHAGGPRLLAGPIRSGVVLDAPGDLVVLGDVNPGAEIQAGGNIIVLGRLRGIAHAAVGTSRGFIFALRLEPQQLRVGTLVARAGEAGSPGQPEIAYATGRTIVVEPYQGKVPL